MENITHLATPISTSVLPDTSWIDRDLYPFKSKFINIAGNAVHYIDEGKGQIILFSHPAITWSFLYRNFIKVLSKKYRCIAIDYPGFGPSVESDNYQVSIQYQASILSRFISELNLKDIIFLGADTGGPTGFHIAVKNPQLFKGIIFTDTLAFPVTDYPKIKKMLGFVSSDIFRSINKWFNFVAKLTVNKGFKTIKLSKVEKQMHLKPFSTHRRRNYIISVLNSLVSEETMMQEISSGLNNELNNHPALLIYGDKDPVTELGVPERIYKTLKNAELHYIKDEGHFPYEAAAKEMSMLIDNWVQKL